MTLTFRDLDPFFVGFEDFFNIDKTTINYPPHNIYKLEDNKFVIELALAGFNKDDVEIENVDNTLTVKSKLNKKEKDLQHKGISNKDFEKSFKLASDIKVKGAELKDGLLKIDLVKDLPKVNKIKIK